MTYAGWWPLKINILIAVLWTALIASLAVWNYRQASSARLEMALSGARESHSKYIVFRHWASVHGGVYVPVSPETPPNPYLAHIQERDITTPSGKRLTLVNPAYMTRQVQELAERSYGQRGHITSLNPIRPENAPDEWERAALLAFERGVKEVSTTTFFGGEEYLRLMRPLITKAVCLRCHAGQGYKTGDVRGGISISLPLSPTRQALNAQMSAIISGYGVAWLVGLAGLLLAIKTTRRQLSELKLSENTIRNHLEEKELLLQEVHHRVKNNMGTIISLLSLQSRAMENSAATGALDEAKSRVQSMMVLYDKLYHSTDHQNISMAEYLPFLVREIVKIFPHAPSVSVETNVEDFTLGANRLMPLGILLNELLTNIMKYAFGENGAGTVRVSASVEDGAVTIIVEDNGIGMPESVSVEQSTGFGLGLVASLVRQLQGTIRVERDKGTRFVLEFRL